MIATYIMFVCLYMEHIFFFCRYYCYTNIYINLFRGAVRIFVCAAVCSYCIQSGCSQRGVSEAVVSSKYEFGRIRTTSIKFGKRRQSTDKCKCDSERLRGVTSSHQPVVGRRLGWSNCRLPGQVNQQRRC